MLAYREFRKNLLHESLTHLSVRRGLERYFDLLKMDLLETGIPAAPLTEIFEGYASYAVNRMIEEDRITTKCVTGQVVDYFRDHVHQYLLENVDEFNKILAAGPQLDPSLAAGDKLKQQIKWAIQNFIDHLKKALVNQFSQTRTSAGGSGGRASGGGYSGGGGLVAPSSSTAAPTEDPDGNYTVGYKTVGGPRQAPLGAKPPVIGQPAATQASNRSWKAPSWTGPFGKVLWNIPASAAKGGWNWLKNAYQGNYLDHVTYQNISCLMEDAIDQSINSALAMVDQFGASLQDYLSRNLDAYVASLTQGSTPPTSPAGGTSPNPLAHQPRPPQPPSGSGNSVQPSPGGSSSQGPAIQPSPGGSSTATMAQPQSHPPFVAGSSVGSPSTTPATRRAPTRIFDDEETFKQKIINGDYVDDLLINTKVKNLQSQGITLPVAPGAKGRGAEKYYNAFRQYFGQPPLDAIPLKPLGDQQLALLTSKDQNDFVNLKNTAVGKRLLRNFAAYLKLKLPSRNEGDLGYERLAMEVFRSLQQPGVADKLRGQFKAVDVNPTQPQTTSVPEPTQPQSTTVTPSATTSPEPTPPLNVPTVKWQTPSAPPAVQPQVASSVTQSEPRGEKVSAPALVHQPRSPESGSHLPGTQEKEVGSLVDRIKARKAARAAIEKGRDSGENPVYSQTGPVQQTDQGVSPINRRPELFGKHGPDEADPKIVELIKNSKAKKAAKLADNLAKLGGQEPATIEKPAALPAEIPSPVGSQGTSSVYKQHFGYDPQGGGTLSLKDVEHIQDDAAHEGIPFKGRNPEDILKDLLHKSKGSAATPSPEMKKEEPVQEPKMAEEPSKPKVDHLDSAVTHVYHQLKNTPAAQKFPEDKVKGLIAQLVKANPNKDHSMIFKKTLDALKVLPQLESVYAGLDDRMKSLGTPDEIIDTLVTLMTPKPLVKPIKQEDILERLENDLNKKKIDRISNGVVQQLGPDYNRFVNRDHKTNQRHAQIDLNQRINDFLKNGLTPEQAASAAADGIRQELQKPIIDDKPEDKVDLPRELRAGKEAMDPDGLKKNPEVEITNQLRERKFPDQRNISYYDFLRRKMVGQEKDIEKKIQAALSQSQGDVSQALQIITQEIEQQRQAAGDQAFDFVRKPPEPLPMTAAEKKAAADELLGVKKSSTDTKKKKKKKKKKVVKATGEDEADDTDDDEDIDWTGEYENDPRHRGMQGESHWFQPGMTWEQKLAILKEERNVRKATAIVGESF